jgi:Flp pilus assembly protein TadG
VAEEALRGDPVITPAPKRRPRPRDLLRPFRRDERGQSLVEFALVFLPLCLIILGGIDFGFVFKDFISARQGVSDAARQASVGQFGSTSPGSANCRSLVGAGGANTQTQNLMCSVLSLVGVNQSRVRVAIDVGDSSHQNTFAGPVDTNGPQPITICVQYQLQSVTGIIPFINGHVATSTATEMIEVSGVSPAPNTAAETSFSGSWPTACTSGPAPA